MRCIMKRTIQLTLLSLLVCFSLISSPNSYAQRVGGMMGGMRSTGGTTSSSTIQRYYYTQGMIGEAIIEADRDTRSLIVITDDYTNEHIKQIIENLDRPIQQVLIKVVFIEVTYRDGVDVGVEGSFDINDNDSQDNIFSTAFGMAAMTQGGFYQVLEKDLQVTVNAISEVGKMEVLSKPSILTRNNQEAVIMVGQEVPYITDSQTTDQGNTINQIEYKDLGIILHVTPFITEKGLVEMMLSPEISNISEESIPISNTVDASVFNKTSADTVVVTPNGQTVVIGGMIQDDNQETVKKVPILGDIPILNLLFRRTTTEKQKKELLIFLTPYVVSGPEGLAELTKNEHGETELVPKAFPEEELSKKPGNSQARARARKD
ncbi:hypothetical protein GF373_00645 [bacterium]|nr:hypothetical protein [bacterium]